MRGNFYLLKLFIGDILPPLKGCGLPFLHSDLAFIPPINGVGFLLSRG